MVDIVKRRTWTTDTLVGLLLLQLANCIACSMIASGSSSVNRLIRLALDDRFVDDIEFTIISAKRSGV